MFTTSIILSALLAGSQLVNAAAIPATTLPASTSSIRARDNADTPLCYWNSAEGFFVAFVVVMPNWLGNNYSLRSANDAFKAKLSGNSACSGFSQYQSGITGNAPTNGPGQNTTTMAGFWASDFCTADQVSKIIHQTTGTYIACSKYGADGTNPHLPEVENEPFESAEPSEVDTIEKRAITLSATTSGDLPSTPNQADIVRDFGLSPSLATAAHEAVVSALSHA